MLIRNYDFKDNVITIHLSNAVEEPLLQGMKQALTTFLRERLNNSDLIIETTLGKLEPQKIAYTNKERFELLAKKYPNLIELKNRLGLDPEF